MWLHSNAFHMNCIGCLISSIWISTDCQSDFQMNSDKYLADVDLNSVELVFGASAVPFVTKVMLRIWDVYLKPVFFVLAVVWILPKLVLRRML